MAITYTVKPLNQLIVVKYLGKNSDKGVISFFSELIDDPELDLHCDLLIDVTDAVVDAPESVERYTGLRRHWNSKWPQSSRIAVIAPLDLTYGMARMHIAYTGRSEEQYQVFRSAQEALAWLDQPASVLED
ncbi:hypothetical protein DV711_11170 [Motiliproteus coralliicola]|uniref:STAS/SEC14 domain-containing protein n=1 Tax=Motiliproteus coralliicola TaxID=2283196 RepID=A0A369WCU0_9GAMM|nr:hypothetical protein [Motiliproteus coralliicola]RDE19447.1 hypothetical protein DV711_11170 [Motiliproteus coralliicola]